MNACKLKATKTHETYAYSVSLKNYPEVVKFFLNG